MPLNFNIPTQVGKTITRAALQTLITNSQVSTKTIYRITDAVSASRVIDVWGLTTNEIGKPAINWITEEFGIYDITADTFTPIGSATGFIPLAGTDVGDPVTGPIAFGSDGYTIELVDDILCMRFTDGATIDIRVKANGTIVYSNLTSGFETTISITDVLAQVSSNDPSFENSATGASIVALGWFKGRFWSAAGAPTVTDDESKAFRVNGYWWDTSTDVIYKASDVTVGAAAWGLAHFGTQYKKLASNYTNSLNTYTDITGASFAMAANSEYDVEIKFRLGQSGSAGTKFGWNVEADTVWSLGVLGKTSGQTVQDFLGYSGTGDFNTAGNPALETSTFQNQISAAGYVIITGKIAAVTAGTFQLQARSVTGTQITTIFADSFVMRVTKI